MTLSTQVNKISHIGNGVTVTFAFPYRFFEDSDLEVYVDDVLLILGTDYTVTGAGDDAGGSVVFTSPPASNASIVIIRVLPFTQEIDYVEGDTFPAESHEEGLDRAVMRDIQLQEEINRAVRLNASQIGGINTELPAPESYGVLSWNIDGTAIENVTVAGDPDHPLIQNITTTNAAAAEAAAARDAALAAQAAAEAAADEFGDTYLGAFTVDPVTDNDGDPLTEGDLYFNTVEGRLKVYTLGGWVNATSSVEGVLETYEYTATEGQTVFTGSDDNGNALIFDAGLELVFRNGVNLDPDDYTLTGGNTVTLLSPAFAGDTVVIKSFGNLSLATNIAVTDAAQTFTASQRGTVTTDPDLSFDLDATNNFSSTPVAPGTLTFTNIVAGQSGNIYLDNTAGVVITADAAVRINSADLTKISSPGQYWVSYYAPSPSIVLVTVSAELTS